jgi:hypothetical protein
LIGRISDGWISKQHKSPASPPLLPKAHSCCCGIASTRSHLRPGIVPSLVNIVTSMAWLTTWKGLGLRPAAVLLLLVTRVAAQDDAEFAFNLFSDIAP